ncbi:MAG: DUF1800 domain-containing protein [Armatimonadota bacterium]
MRVLNDEANPSLAEASNRVVGVMQSLLRERLAHLLRRAGLSASRAEVERYLPLGIEGTIDALLHYDQEPETIDDAEILRLLRGDSLRLQPQMVSAWWIYRMLVTRRPLQERMALFWHNHFATSASKVNDGRLMLMQIQLFQRLGVGNFGTLVLEVARDPAMLVWLDGFRNVKGKPNENFARELLELFTMGIGHYTEQDIKEAARAFTGWTYSRVTGAFVFNRAQHDDGEKVFLGRRGRFGGEDIVRMAVEHPATATSIARKFYRHFVNDIDPPDEKAIAALAKTFTESGYEIKALLRRLLTSTVFWSERAFRKRIKSPVEFVIGTLRQVGVGERLREVNLSAAQGQRTLLAFLRLAGQWMRRMGQALLYPPDVAGWEWGTAWISSATMLERMRFAQMLTGPAIGAGGRGRVARPALTTLRALAGDTPPETLEAFVDRLEQTLDVRLQKETRRQLIDYLQAKGGLDALHASDRELINGALQIVFASAEYQFL